MKKLNLYALLLMLVFGFLSLNSQAQKHKKKQKNPQESQDALSKLNLNVFKYRSIGPALTSGRIVDLAVNPDNSSEFYVAAAAGGVWKTTNAGISFKPIFEHQGSYSIGCVRMDPNNHNVIWVGTGENNNQRSVSFGDGVYKSNDGGESWTNMGLKDSEHIGMISIDPENSDIVYVAAYGPVWRVGGDRGIYKTIDGGKSWKRILFVSDKTGFNEVHLDPRNPNVIYATAHQRIRKQWTYLGGGPESGIYKSTDAGKSWEKINKGLPSGDKGRIGMAISPANPEILFAVVEAQKGQGGFFKSTNRGMSWKKMNSTSTSGNYYQEVVPDPLDANRVYLNNTFTKVSIDGGKTFSNRGERSKHYDNHVLWIDPKNPLHHLEGTDGGLYESYDRGTTWRFFPNLPVTQFYKVTVDNDFPFYNVAGGTQDNYSLVGPSQNLSDHGVSSFEWKVTVTGDGFESAIDPVDPNIVYAQAQYGSLARIDKKSGESVSITPIARENENAYNFNWDAPLLISPHNHNTLYFAANKLFKSKDRGDSWEVISDDLDQNIDRNKWPLMGKWWPMDAVAKNGSTSRYGAIVSLDESPLQEGLIYAGTDDGQISITEDGGKSWRKVNHFPGVPDYTYVYDIIASKVDVNTVYAAFNHHKSGDFKPYVLKSTDKGKSWTSISSNLPEKGAVYALEQDYKDGNILFAGTEYSVFVSLNEGKSWHKLASGLPTINVRDMAIQKRENDLVLATFGRGFYILPNYAPLRELNKSTLDKEAYLFQVKTGKMYKTWRPLGGLGSKEKGFQGESFYTSPNPAVGVDIMSWIKNAPSSLKSERLKKEAQSFKKGELISYPSLEEYKAEKLEPKAYLLYTIEDEKGNFIRELRAPLRAGLNKIHWDLEYPITDLLSKEDADLSKGLSSSGIFVLPGKYQVRLSKSVNGKTVSLAGPISFKVEALDNRTIPAKDRNELVSFKQKALQLNNAIYILSRELNDWNKKIPFYQASSKAFSGQKAEQILEQTQKLKKKLSEIQNELFGDRDYATLDLDTKTSLSNRASSAIYDIYNSTSNIPGAAKANFKWASENFQNLIQKVKSLKTEFDAMDQHLDQLNAPITPGRLH
jgi:photosystem II stability/assembly factor-like uncharacterized protein